jgi:hypothetical protein
VVRIFGSDPAMSTPTSFIASTAEGLTRSPGTEPAERTSIRSPARWERKPAAICERPALWTQTNSTEASGLEGIGFFLRRGRGVSPGWYQSGLM